MTRILPLLLLALVASTSACTANSFCGKKQECDTKRVADDEAVCVAEYNGNLNALYANAEKGCHTLADAQVALDGCLAGLSCADFEANDHGGQCVDQQKAFENAVGNIDGNECSSSN
jgi:hypothetical protein